MSIDKRLIVNVYIVDIITKEFVPILGLYINYSYLSVNIIGNRGCWKITIRKKDFSRSNQANRTSHAAAAVVFPEFVQVI